MKDELKEIIDSYLEISKKSLSEIADKVEFQIYQKGNVFIPLNKNNSKEYFVIDGICKSYLINPEGEEITISFFTDKSILSPHQTRTSKGKSILNFKALTELKLAAIDAKEFEKLMIDNLEIREFANRVLQVELMFKIQKEIGLATMTAKERLLTFRKQYKALENYIPHPDIASFLGITNISLSRIRKELSE